MRHRSCPYPRPAARYVRTLITVQCIDNFGNLVPCHLARERCRMKSRFTISVSECGQSALCMHHSRTLTDGIWHLCSRLLSALGFYLSDETGELFADLAQLIGSILGWSRQSFFGAGMSLWVRAGSEIRLKKSLFTATSRFLVGHDFLLLPVGRRSLPCCMAICRSLADRSRAHRFVMPTRALRD